MLRSRANRRTYFLKVVAGEEAHRVTKSRTHVWPKSFAWLLAPIFLTLWPSTFSLSALTVLSSNELMFVNVDHAPMGVCSTMTYGYKGDICGVGTSTAFYPYWNSSSAGGGGGGVLIALSGKSGLQLLPFVTSASNISTNAHFFPDASVNNLKRATLSGGPYAPLTNGVVGASFVDTALSNGTTYFYVLTATNQIGESAPSPEARATPVPSVGTNIFASLSGLTITISWPSAYFGWILQTNTVGLGNPTAWGDLPGSVTQSQMTFPVGSPNSAAEFFRLRHP